MSFFHRLNTAWRTDPLLRRVVQNSSHLLSSSTIGAGVSFAQGILVARLIGIPALGLVTTIITFVSNVNRLLTFRMSEMVVKRLNGALAEDRPHEGAAAVKAALLIESITSLAAYLILLALAGWAVQTFAADFRSNPLTADLFRFYGLILLTNFVTETSTGILQAARRFAWIARLSILQSLTTAVVILAAFLLRRGVSEVVLAYVIGKSINGLGLAFLAQVELRRLLGANWWRTPLQALPQKRALVTFLLNTNLNGTVNLFTRDNFPLYAAWLLNSEQVGYYRLAQMLINFIILPLDPLIWPTYAEITQTVAQKNWAATRRLLRRVSLLTGSLVLMVGAGLALTGWFLLPLVYGPQAAPAYPILLVLLAGYGFASTFQWNRPLFLALGKPGYPVLIALLTGCLELLLMFTLVPIADSMLLLSTIFSGYFILSIGLTAWRGWNLLPRS
ncbi:MAG: oligosaccharide flippase family protein [Anaerolineales bacterium]|nr:oligosaccharide flippase family protein [Anaerolineales bacterium]MCX7755134.1 oligosaccharide flippase family protein [Anaerolineales bacterium]MDW8279202.1 oligosaccharide flippase family protein [Anaerolineales bacterium]